jgi:hypothetical protein
MSPSLLQINFKLTVPVAEYEAMVTPRASAIASVPGLQWKIWVVNADQGEAGGFYLFESETAARAYAAGPIVSALRAAPFAQDVTLKHFAYLDVATAITQGPVGVPKLRGTVAIGLTPKLLSDLESTSPA